MAIKMIILAIGNTADSLIEVNSDEHMMLNLTKKTQKYTRTYDVAINANLSGQP
jgi:hypothetical protein